MTQRVAVYIDGFNLRHARQVRPKYLWLDLAAMAGAFLTPHKTLESVTYFTARVRNDPPAQAPSGSGPMSRPSGNYERSRVMRSVEIPGPGGRVYNVDLPDDAPDVDGATVVVELLANEVHVQAREAGKPGSTYKVLPGARRRSAAAARPGRA